MKYSYNSKISNKKLIILIAVIVVIGMFGILISSGITGMSIFEKSPQKVNIGDSKNLDVEMEEIIEEPVCIPVEEVYTELEPYTETECITIPVIETVNKTQELRYEINKECYWSNNLQTLNTKCAVRNLDDQEGNFVIEIGVMNKNDERIGEERSIDVHAQSSVDIRYSHDLNMGTCYCAVIEAPVKEIKYDKITETEECFELNKYREVEKTRITDNC